MENDQLQGVENMLTQKKEKSIDRAQKPANIPGKLEQKEVIGEAVIQGGHSGRAVEITTENAQGSATGQTDYTTDPNGCATISVKEVAKLMGCCETSIYDAIRQDRFPHLKLGKKVVIPRLALQRMLESGELHPQVTEQRIVVDERIAVRVAELVTKQLLELEQQRITDQVRQIGGRVVL